MSEKKYTKEELRKKIEEDTKKVEQYEHQINRIQMKIAYMDKKPWQIKRDQRTHRIASKGGIIEHFFPDTKDFDDKEFYQLMEYIYEYPGMQQAVASQINRVRIKKEKPVYSPFPTGSSDIF